IGTQGRRPEPAAYHMIVTLKCSVIPDLGGGEASAKDRQLPKRCWVDPEADGWRSEKDQQSGIQRSLRHIGGNQRPDPQTIPGEHDPDQPVAEAIADQFAIRQPAKSELALQQ